MILTSAFCVALPAQDAPPGLVKKVIARETETEQAQAQFTYRQTVVFDEIDKRGSRLGEYREVRDIVLSPSQERSEQLVGKPTSDLRNLQMTPEDFRDIREVHPFLLTTAQAFLYETKFRGDESVDGIDCWVLQVKPRQILDGQRLFEGTIWVDKRDFSTIRSEGQAVPELRTPKSENLFPHFTTIRRRIPGGMWFPVLTYADDTLYFSGGAQRVRLSIRYEQYKRFGADSTITFEQ